MRALIAAAALLLSTPAFAQTSPATSTVTVDHAWARATASTQKVGGVFFTVTGAGAPDQLIGITSPLAATVELHETVQKDGIMRMQAVPKLDLAPGKPVELKPGGYHVMMMGLKQPLKQGETFPVTLRFAHAAPVTTTVTVQSAGASGMMDHTMMHTMTPPKP